MNYRDQTAQLATVAEAHHAGKRCVVVFMGDIHFSGFQYLERVERACGHPVETVPAYPPRKYSRRAPKSVSMKPLYYLSSSRRS